jgi:hypothetical protein
MNGWERVGFWLYVAMAVACGVFLVVVAVAAVVS